MSAARPHAPRTKECKHCDKPFVPARPMQVVCSPRCAAQMTKVRRAKEKQADRERKKALETIPDLIKAAQREFNAYIRERDKDKPCICCGRGATAVDGLGSHGWDAGHYRSTGSASHLRFNEANCHRQLVHCNRYGAGRAVDYRIGLIARIGLAAVEALEADNTTKKWTHEELRDIAAKYRQKRKELERQRD